MNLVGKIFTVLIFLMCVVFGTFALMVHAAHKNWKVEAIELSKELTKANGDRTALTEEKKSLENAIKDETERHKRVLIALAQQCKTLAADLDKKDKQLLDSEQKNREATASLGEATKRIGVMETENEGMRNNIKVARDDRDAIRKKLVDTTDDLMNAVAERKRLEKLQGELAAQVMKMKDAFEYLKFSENDKAKFAPEGLEGEVLSVPNPQVVEISIGADDGVRKGQQFVVTRPSTNKYIGVIEVTSVEYPNRAVCHPDRARQNDQIYKGDHVKAISKPR